MAQEIVDLFLKMALRGASSLGNPEATSLITELLSFGKIELDPQVESLAVGYGPWGYDMRISPGFVEEHCSDSPENALFLLLHEISHKVKGDLWADRRHLIGPSQREWQIANLAADMIIDRHLERQFFPKSVPLIEKLYRPDRWPEILLASPMLLKDYLCSMGEMKKDEELDEDIIASHLARLGCKHPRWAALCYMCTLLSIPSWSTEWNDLADPGELYLELREILQDTALDDLQFLGDHGAEEGSSRIWLDADLSGMLTAVRSPRPKGGIGDDLFDKTVSIEEACLKEQQAILLSAIRRAMVEDGGKPRLIPKATVAERGILFNPGRRELFLLAAGHYPVFYPQPLSGPGCSEDRLWLYVDASGSMDDMLPIIYGLLNALRDHMAHSPILLFSNKVAPVSIAQIQRGECPTTHGTDYDCVIEHAREEGARRIMILTDGFGDLAEKSRQFVRQAGVEIYLVLSEVLAFYGDCPIVPLARHVWVWPASP